MAIHSRAGQVAQQQDLCNIPRLIINYYQGIPNVLEINQRVSFGTSGHRGCSNDLSFNEIHILAITQAVVDVRKQEGINGPLFVGKDTHALSEPASNSVLEVLIANGVSTYIQTSIEGDANSGYAPTPGISHAILTYNQQADHQTIGQADGIVITPSHNPPHHGGIKYNPPHGGPAEGRLTTLIEQRANLLIEQMTKEGIDKVIKRVSYAQALKSPLLTVTDFSKAYVGDLINVIDIKAIQKAKLKLGVDPLGGAGIDYWRQIKECYGLDITLTKEDIDPSFRFMSLDKDGAIRMDCSSPYAMQGLLANKNRFDLGFGNDPDYDRHGIVTPDGLMDPNQYLVVCIDYLFRHRPQWRKEVGIGKTLVSSAIIDKVAHDLGRKLFEMPVGFKWFVDGLYEGKLGFSGEESAGASFLRHNGQVWTTDKDGIILCLLAAEILAVTGLTPYQYYQKLIEKHGTSYYNRLQASVTPTQKKILLALSPDDIKTKAFAGDPILDRITHASGNQQAIGGLKIVTKNGWFTARPSGTEDMYKIYCESFKDEPHLKLIEQEAQQLINTIFEEKN